MARYEFFANRMAWNMQQLIWLSHFIVQLPRIVIDTTISFVAITECHLQVKRMKRMWNNMRVDEDTSNWIPWKDLASEKHSLFHKFLLRFELKQSRLYITSSMELHSKCLLELSLQKDTKWYNGQQLTEFNLNEFGIVLMKIKRCGTTHAVYKLFTTIRFPVIKCCLIFGPFWPCATNAHCDTTSVDWIRN